MGKIKRLYKTDRAQDFDHEQVCQFQIETLVHA